MRCHFTIPFVLLCVLAFTRGASAQAGWLRLAGPPCRVLTLDEVPGGDLLAGTSCGLYRSPDQGMSWRVPGPDSVVIDHILVVATDTLFVSGPGGVHRSHDGGAAWSLLTEGLPAIYPRHMPPGRVAVDARGRLYAVIFPDPTGRGGGLYASEDGGDSWTFAAFRDDHVVALDVASGRLFSATSGCGLDPPCVGRIYRHASEGWEEATFWPEDMTVIYGAHTVTRFRAVSEDVILAATTINGIFRSVDGGMTWAQTGFDSLSVDALAIGRRGYVVAGTGRGVLQSLDAGTSWTFWDDELRGQWIEEVLIDEADYLYAVTDEGHLYRKKVMPVTVEAAPDRPRLVLGPSYPNPFTASTTLSFTVGAPGPVTLRVFDVMGRQVALLVNAVLPSGTHEVDWDGAGVPAGSYFVRVVSSGSSRVRPITLVR